MGEYELDDTDRQLLSLLEENARYTAVELAEEIGVSDNTIHNRIARLEDADVLTGYTATVDSERIGFELCFLFSCSARISVRSDVAEEALEIPEVIEVTELMTGQDNLYIKVLGESTEHITHVAEQLDQLNLEINDENLVRMVYTESPDYAELDWDAIDS